MSSPKQRVNALCEAISNLHIGDLRQVLKLDRFTPMMEFGDDDLFSLSENGKGLIVKPGSKPPPKTLRHRVTNGTDLGRILEHHLIEVMSFGEVFIPTTQKTNSRARKELGGREF